MALFADPFFNFARDVDGAAVLVGDNGRERIAFVIHGEPGGGHNGEADGVDGFGSFADIGNGVADRFENGAGIDLDFDSFAAGWITGAGDAAGDFAVFEDGGLDGGGADVEGEEVHGYLRVVRVILFLHHLRRPGLVLFVGFGGFGGWGLGAPFGVEDAGLVDALVSVGAEEVALGLDQIGGEALAAV